MSSKSPLGQARGLGSAKTGAENWWAQRWTALALVPLVLWFVIMLIAHLGDSYVMTRAWIGHPVTASLLIVLVVVAFWHAVLGLQVVIEDYVHGEAMKIGSLLAVKGAAAVLAVVTVVSVLRIALEGGA